MPFFETRDGTSLAYEDYGGGPPIVFVAGWVLNSGMWEYQLPCFLQRGYRCVLPDRRGHGRSDRPSGGYDLDTRADDLAMLLEHLDLREATLVTHSAGGGEAARYLARHGDGRVARVAFLAPTLPFLKQTEDNPEGLPQAACDESVVQFHRDRPKWFADRAQGYFATHLGNDVSPALIDNEMRRCLSASPVATVAMWESSFHADHREDLRAITVPVLVVHGAADQSAPVELTGRRAAKMIPGCVYHEYPTAGHGLYVTHAEQINADLVAFIDGAA
jgi:pimeloyl-ACP methyl ester carboxylesterase